MAAGLSILIGSSSHGATAPETPPRPQAQGPRNVRPKGGKEARLYVTTHLAALADPRGPSTQRRAP